MRSVYHQLERISKRNCLCDIAEQSGALEMPLADFYKLVPNMFGRSSTYLVGPPKIAGELTVLKWIMDLSIHVPKYVLFAAHVAKVNVVHAGRENQTKVSLFLRIFAVHKKLHEVPHTKKSQDFFMYMFQHDIHFFIMLQYRTFTLNPKNLFTYYIRGRGGVVSFENDLFKFITSPSSLYCFCGRYSKRKSPQNPNNC